LHDRNVRVYERVPAMPQGVTGLRLWCRRHRQLGKLASRHTNNSVSVVCYRGDGNEEDFGLRDLRAKRATDMVRRGIGIRRVHHLLGHASVRTTEIYIKGLLPTTVQPNETPIIASVK
jgi:integrase